MSNLPPPVALCNPNSVVEIKATLATNVSVPPPSMFALDVVKVALSSTAMWFSLHPFRNPGEEE